MLRVQRIASHLTAPLLSNDARRGGALRPLATASAARSALLTRLDAEVQAIRDAGTYKTERVLRSTQGPVIDVVGRSAPVINLCANNYLGLAGDTRVVDAAIGSLRERGFGLSSVRFICGTTDRHRELEDRIARFHGTEVRLFFNVGANNEPGRDSVPVVLRRQRRLVRSAAERRGRRDQRRAEPRVHH